MFHGLGREQRCSSYSITDRQSLTNLCASDRPIVLEESVSEHFKFTLCEATPTVVLLAYRKAAQRIKFHIF